MTVYVTQEAEGLDYSTAEQYGQVVFLTRHDFVNVRGSLANEALISELNRKLRGFNPETDWIVVSGSPYVAAAVLLLLGLARHRQVKFLRWDNRDYLYRPLYIELPSARVQVEIGDRL